MKRVLVTGMGGSLGTTVANLLERDPDVDEILGVDDDPPRRRIHRARFHRVDPRHRPKLLDLVGEFDPTVILHLGVYEPNARTGPASARLLTEAGTEAVLAAAARCSALEGIVVRSGTEVYGRRRGSPLMPDEGVAADPSSPFGVSMLSVERAATAAGAAASVPVAHVRCAPIVGSSLASPLGRYLRLPVVPVSVLSDLPFSVVHLNDAAAALVAAGKVRLNGPVNVVGPGAVTPFQAARLGRRLPLPFAGPAWALARVGAEMLGAPLPDHVHELLVRGRTADGSRAGELLGMTPAASTEDVIRELYAWAPVTFLSGAGIEAA